ncbi:type IV secretion protein [Salmonella enterica subsp. enterica serovar Rubislaw]|nr:TrbI/VirB10 family protein [Salmonella enterica]ECR8559891.1 TrbI/VirB10 family protein [Salmonella enterica]EEE4193670.1 type IV secretion protein [Salmonella enterica subsp. enterica serovar Rubislaw]EIR4526145.1 type IV secretion system protein VirB10 [Salmonella enterica]EIW3856098.1 type IV secretion system protein VirB10 [Salmonella enterica]
MAKDRDDLDTEIEQEDADRGMPSISKNRKTGKASGIGQKIVAVIIGIIVILALIAVNGGFKGSEEDKPPKLAGNTSVANRLGPPPSLPPPPAPPKTETPKEDRMLNTGQIAPPPPSSASGTGGNGKHEQTPDERKRASSILAFGSISKPQQPGQKADNGQPVQMAGEVQEGNSSLSETDRADSLSNRLKGTEVSGSRASLLVDRSYFITQGTFLNCALETAISSDVPGMTACRLTDDVYSTDKKVLLLEKGSKIVGQYQGGIKRGQARIFVLWTRIETPKGVLVKLDSPGTDALGRSGLDGFVDTHFWERFGSAIMLTTVDGLITYGANSANNGSNGNQYNFGDTAQTARDSASIALENSINIPPTLTKNQGDNISIFVARDLDFRGVYDLKAAY